MKLTVLGSGNADAHAERACAGHLLEVPAPILLDFGPGCWRNLVRNGTDPAAIRLILVSHLHADHWSDLVPFLFHQSWSTEGTDRPPLTVVGPPGTAEAVAGVRRAVPRLERHGFPIDVREMEGGELEFDSVRVRPVPVPHVEDLRSVAWRVEGGGRTFVYSGDCRADRRTEEALRGADLAVVEATFPDEHPFPSHLTAGEACAAAKAAGVKRLVLAHLSRKWDGRDPAAECRGRFPGPVDAATDLFRADV